MYTAAYHGYGVQLYKYLYNLSLHTIIARSICEITVFYIPYLCHAGCAAQDWARQYALGRSLQKPGYAYGRPVIHTESGQPAAGAIPQTSSPDPRWQVQFSFDGIYSNSL